MTIHRSIPDREEIFAFVGNLFDQLVLRNLAGTSKVAVAFGCQAELRFRDNFRRAGGDHLCGTAISAPSARSDISTIVEVRYARDVNVDSN